METVKEGDFFRMAEREFQFDYPFSSGSIVPNDTSTPASKFRPGLLSKKALSKPLTRLNQSEAVEPLLPVTSKPPAEGCWEISWSVLVDNSIRARHIEGTQAKALILKKCVMARRRRFGDQRDHLSSDIRTPQTVGFLILSPQVCKRVAV